MASPNVQTALAYLDAGFRNDYDACAPLIGDGYEWIDRARGIHARTTEQLTEAMQDDSAWSDRDLELEQVMETTDGAVIVQGTVSATHTGTWCAVPATGKRVTFMMCDIFRFDAQGRIASEDCYQDLLAVFAELGAVQSPNVLPSSSGDA